MISILLNIDIVKNLAIESTTYINIQKQEEPISSTA